MFWSFWAACKQSWKLLYGYLHNWWLKLQSFVGLWGTPYNAPCQPYGKLSIVSGDKQTNKNNRHEFDINLFITNNPDSIVNSGVCTLSISDHNLVYAVRKIGIPRKNPKYVETRNFKHFKANSFKIDLINAQWPVINRISCVNEAWGKWKSVFLNILNNHAPKRIIRVRNKPAPWLNSRVRQLMLNRDYLKKKAVKTGLQNDWLSFKKVKNRVNYAIRREKAS